MSASGRAVGSADLFCPQELCNVPSPLTGKARNEARAHATASGPVRVLMIGGTSDEAERIGKALADARSLAFELVHVPRLASATGLIQASEIDVMLVEVPHQGESLALLNQVRVRAAEIPVVALGDLDDETLAMKTLQSGARGYVLKREANTRVLVTSLGAALNSQRTILQLNAARERARDLATCDHLTGLANRLLFNDRVYQSVAAARRSRRAVAIMFLDLDGFKVINDTLGHAVGDGFLRATAHRLTTCLRETDTAARLGGDEFALLLTHLSSDLDAATVAQNVLDSVSIPMVLKNRTLVTTASLGIATFPKDGAEPEQLLKKADTAMYQAKKRGRNRYEFFTEEMNTSILRRAAMESRLHSALEQNQFFMLYQPQFDLRRGRVIGAEALLRWQHPELGLLSPGEFLPAAEQAALLGPIGEWVLRTTCRESAAWQREHPGFRVSVNVASQQFHDPRFATRVREALEGSGLPPDCLELELTESNLVQDVETMVHTLHALKRVGVSISIDDFGTGYSALAYLKNLPIDTLKIDQSFVRNLTTDPADATLTETIIRMAQGLNLMTVAEGVETSEQLLLLGSYGCQRVQGFLLGKPMPADELLRSLANPAMQWWKPHASRAPEGSGEG